MSSCRSYEALFGSELVNKTTKNIAASVRQKIKNKAREGGRPFAELLQYYAMERFLYRLTMSKHADRFILKGALMLRVWQTAKISNQSRSTMDVDMLGTTSNNIESICSQVADIISIESTDGLVFDHTTLQGKIIKEDAEYEGVRVRFKGILDSALVHMQIDIGFDDVIYPNPILAELPTVLDSPAPKLLCYTRESVIAEKFEAMIKLEELNSRMKDFYDIWFLCREFEFDGRELSEAIRLTFMHRGTEIPNTVSAFTDEFINAKDKQWSAFYNRLGQEYVCADFGDIVGAVEVFLEPVALALFSHEEFSKKWSVDKIWE